jgi:hypothetical protein
MGFFSSLGKVLAAPFKAIGKTVVGKILGTIGAVIAAPFTGGLSLLSLPLIIGGGRKGVKSLGRFTGLNPIGKPIEDEPIKRFPIKEPKVEVKIEPIEEVVSGVGRGAITGEKEDVTLFGYYNKINFVTIPVDNDFGNIRVVEDTYFPYVAVVDNHTPSNGLRYVSRFTFDNLLSANETNLDKVLYDLDKANGNFAYIAFNWTEFVDKYLSQSKGLTADNGKVKWTLTPDFMLKWLDGDSKPTFILDYSYGIPAGVKTVFDLQGDSKEATESPIQKATNSPDTKKISRLQNILGTIGSGVAYANLALATAGQIKSRFENATGAIKNLSETAKGLQGKFNDVKGMLTKDYINGKISDLKSLVNKSLPKKGSFKSFFVREKTKIKDKIAERKRKQKQRRDNKDPKVKVKLTIGGALDKATGALDKVSSKLDTLPKIPKGLTKGINAVSKLSAGVGNLGGGLSLKSLVSTALPGLSNLQVPNFKNINWANPLDALDGLTGGLEAINSIGQKVVNTNFDINVPKGVGPFYAMNEKEAKIAAETAFAERLAADFAARKNAKNIKPLTPLFPTQLKSLTLIQPPSLDRILSANATVQVGTTTSFGSNNIGTKAPGPFVATSDKAYFHSNSNATSRRSAYIVRGQGGTFTKVENNFGYLTFTYNGRVTEGWIQLSDVKMS